MPKTRSSGNTIASRGGSGGGQLGGSGGGGIGPGGNAEMSQRIENRMEETRTVEVPMMSQSRGTLENLRVTFDPSTPGVATVQSPSGRTYAVNTEDNTCDCPDHRYRQSRCRHIEAVTLAQDQVGQGVTGGSAAAAEINTYETLREHINNEAQLERQNIERGFRDEGHFYTDNMAEFSQDMQRLRSAEVPYEYNNVLNGSDITFGIELEFVDGNSNAIARDLYDLGICSHPRMLGYNSDGVPGKWKLERDGSVSDGDFGGELVSPILRDTPETWKQIETICQVAKRHGARVNIETGGHVHVSTDPLDGKRQRWKRLFKAFKGHEEAILRFSGGELGVMREGLGTDYAKRSQAELAAGISARLPEEGDINDFRRALASANIGADRYKTINFNSFSMGKYNYRTGQYVKRDTIEIRSFNGSLTPGVIQANVKMAVGLMHAAERCKNDGAITEHFKRRAGMINQHDRNTRDDSSIVRMLDTFFTRKSDKEHVLAVIAKNNWRRL